MLDAAIRTAYRLGYPVFRLWWFVRRPRVRGAYVAVWHDGRLLLIRNSYKTGETVPCGGLRRGESPRAGARRELEEEVGIAVHEGETIRFLLENPTVADEIRRLVLASRRPAGAA